MGSLERSNKRYHVCGFSDGTFGVSLCKQLVPHPDTLEVCPTQDHVSTVERRKPVWHMHATTPHLHKALHQESAWRTRHRCFAIRQGKKTLQWRWRFELFRAIQVAGHFSRKPEVPPLPELHSKEVQPNGSLYTGTDTLNTFTHTVSAFTSRPRHISYGCTIHL